MHAVIEASRRISLGVHTSSINLRDPRDTKGLGGVASSEADSHNCRADFCERARRDSNPQPSDVFEQSVRVRESPLRYLAPTVYERASPYECGTIRCDLGLFVSGKWRPFCGAKFTVGRRGSGRRAPRTALKLRRAAHPRALARTLHGSAGETRCRSRRTRLVDGPAAWLRA